MQFSMDETELRAAKLLENLLHEVPVLKLKQINVGSEGREAGIDIMMRVDISGESHFLVCEVKQNGQPRYVRDGIHQLQNYVAHFKKPATPVLVAPYFSPVSRELCLAACGRSEKTPQLWMEAGKAKGSEREPEAGSLSSINSMQRAANAVIAIWTSKIASERPCKVLGLPIPEDFRISSARLNPMAWNRSRLRMFF